MSNDPYVTPNSNLEASISIKRSWGWKLYFGFMILLTLLGLFGYTVMENVGYAELFTIILIVPAYVGFYGYVFSKKILFKRFWSINLMIQIIWGVAYYFVTKVDLAAGMDRTSFFLTQGVMWIISVPYYLALFLYGFRSTQLWNSEEA